MSINLSEKETTPKKETTAEEPGLVLMDGSNDDDIDNEVGNTDVALPQASAKSSSEDIFASNSSSKESGNSVADVSPKKDANDSVGNSAQPSPSSSSKNMSLQLGDVIKIKDPSNEILNDNVFIIDYIDNTKIKLIGETDLNEVQLKINPDGTLSNNTIQSISILSRSEYPGFARQNDLLPGKWINIYFGGDIPTVLTGEITNLEEDMIEIRLYPDNTIIYLNFACKGIPENLPIENIEIRQPPEAEKQKQPQGEGEGELPSESQGEYESEMEEEPRLANLAEEEREEQEQVFFIPSKKIKQGLRQIILNADQIKFGPDLGKITQIVTLEKGTERFSLEMQTNDILDQMLSTIPNSQRTARVLNNIHTMIERFIQLREQFSQVDQYGNVEGIEVKGANYKPLCEQLSQMKNNLMWVVFIAKNIKKVYNVNSNESIDYQDITKLDINDDVKNMEQLLDMYKANSFPDEQNKYVELIHSLNPYFTPFEEPNRESTGIIYESFVQSNINAIIDNLDDFKSSIVHEDVIKTRKYIVQKYNLGETHLHVSQFTGSRMNAKLVKLTDPDVLSLTSIMTLPEPAVRFSRVSLPGTDILSKANLNNTFLNYWQLLKKKTFVNNIFVDTLKEDLPEDVYDTYFDNIKNFALSLSDEERSSPSLQTFKQYLNTIIPKTRVLFKIISKYITGKVSMVEIINYMEPFLVYSDDLTFMQYIDINKFIDESISSFNKSFIEKRRSFGTLKNIVDARTIDITLPNSRIIVDTLRQLPEKNAQVWESYGVTRDNVLTNAELIRKITLNDYGSLYNIAIAMENLPLMFPDSLAPIFNNDKQALDRTAELAGNSNKCAGYVIAKKYSFEKDVEADNGRDIYFDKEYDNTPYGIMDDFLKEQSKMPPEEFIAYLNEKLQSKYKYSEEDAEYIAESLFNGIKKVREGQYAIMFNTVTDQFDYYMRKNGRWVLDEGFDRSFEANESGLLCDLQPDCLFIPKSQDGKCEDTKMNKAALANNALKQIMSEFDENYKISKQELTDKIGNYFAYYTYVFPKLDELAQYNLLKYNNQKFKLGMQLQDEPAVVLSPYAKLRDIILGQTDFVKRQNDIIRFCISFTREAISGQMDVNEAIEETVHWRYCIKTGVKLMPTFLYTLASAFVQDYSGYDLVMNQVIDQIGKISDDGDKIVDEYSGYTICNRAFSNEEGFEDGFRVKTREILEKDAGDALLTTAQEKKPIKFSSPEAKMVANIVDVLSVNMGINLNDQMEFIVRTVTNTLPTILPKEEDYKKDMIEKEKKGKKVVPYEDVYHSTILYVTLGMFLIAIQTNMPSIKTRKTYPGCVKSLNGFPIEGAGDYSSVKYLACVAYKTRSSIKPWNVIMKTKEDVIAAKIQAFIENYLITNQEITRKFREKEAYLLLHGGKEIPQEHSIDLWTNFLPPLMPFKISGLASISQEFAEGLLADLQRGSPAQTEKIAVIQSKIIQFSLAFQEVINKIIEKKNALLTNSANEPFLENACCNETGFSSTFDYFTSVNKDVSIYNDTVQNLSNILRDINLLTKSAMFFSREDTKLIYPPLSQDFNEETIYRAFIVYCKFNTLAPIPEELLPICIEKPDFFMATDSIIEKIRKLKNDGRNYSLEAFLRLFQIVSRNNIVNVNLYSQTTTIIQKMRELFEKFDEDDEQVVPRALRDHIESNLDTFDVGLTEDPPEMRDFKNYLGRTNRDMKRELLDFIKKNSTITKSQLTEVDAFLTNLMSWGSADDAPVRNLNMKITDDAMYESINFIKTYIFNMIKVFPNIILNQINYDEIVLPKYWNLSLSHYNDVKKGINEYYKSLRQFYGNKSLTNLLNEVQDQLENMLLLANFTPAMSNITYEGEENHAIFNKKISLGLFEHYILEVFLKYISLTDDESILEIESVKKLSDDIFGEDSEDEAERERQADEEFDVRNPESFRQQTEGYRSALKKLTAKLLLEFINIMMDHKKMADNSYEYIMDRVFKLREKEKDTFTDRLQNLTDEERDADTILKINKLGVWSKGLQKGLTKYVKEDYDDEKILMEKLVEAERTVTKNKNVTAQNMQQYVDDFLEQEDEAAAIEEEEYDMRHMTEDYMDGDYEGAEEENYDEYN
jgi:hypothetical protein